jgi:hypothetical protein
MTPPRLLALVDNYLALRRNLGFDVEKLGWLLRDFARYTERTEHRGPITVDLAVQWALSPGSGDPARAERRLGAVRQFARHRAAFDPATEVPPAGLLGRIPRRRQPHIYSDAEISALLRECSRLWPPDGLRPTTYVAFFSLLASTGLRLSEPRRDSRRLHSLRGWRHDKTQQVFPGGPGPGGADGPGAAGEARLAVGGDHLDRGEVRVLGGDAEELAAAGRA